MKLFVEREGELITTTVESLSKDFSKFIQSNGKTIKTNDKREISVLPYVFERIDESDVYIVRRLDTEYIKEEFMVELKDSLK